MSGHSKWSSIKHQKAVTDAKRGQVFTKLTREIIVAVREGGANPESNFRLRLAVQRAHDSNMPMENIDRAIRRGSGEGGGITLAEMVLEGYGPSGAAILVQALSDNRNRTIQEIRNIFSRGGGSLGEAGCVAWIFDSKGLITVASEGLDDEELALQAIDAGADDVKVDAGGIQIYTKPEEMEAVRAALEKQSVPVSSAEVCMAPKTTVELEEKAAEQMLRLLNKLEELDEVQHVSTNANFPDSVLEAIH